jgi:hemolysin III
MSKFSFKKLKEPFCSISHGVGVLLSLAGLIALLIFARGKGWHLLAFSVYGISLLTLYAASTLYHSLRVSQRVEERLARFDYCAIYFLIAGSYTPVCVVALGGAVGWALLGAVWVLAIGGILACLFWKNNPDWLRMTLYLVMGWMVVFALSPLRAALPGAAIGWLVAGGVAYSIGAVILATDRPHLWPGKFSAHDLWHLFVLGGSICHFVMMFGFIAPLPLPPI